MERAGDQEIGESPREQHRHCGACPAEPEPHERPHQPRPRNDPQRPRQTPLAELLHEVPVGDRADVLPGVGCVHHAADHGVLRHDLAEVLVELEHGERVGYGECDGRDETGGCKPQQGMP